MKKRLSKFILLISILVVLHTSLIAQVEFSGDISGVSTYVWRGVKRNSGAAIQSTAEGSYGIVTSGFWGSSIRVGDNTEVETDLYASVALPTGDLSTSLGAQVYMFDFRQFNSAADAELELFANLGYSVFGLNIYYVPEQNSTDIYQNKSNYWLELGGTGQVAGADLSAQIGYGTYSSRWVSSPTEDPVSLLLLTAATSVTDDTSIFWSYSHNIEGGIENIFYFGGTYSF